MSELSAKQVVLNFWQAMETNDFNKAAGWLTDDYIGDWVLSNERIVGRENFIAINSAYPANGLWKFTLNRLIHQGKEVVTEVDVTDGTVTARVISFHHVTDNKIRSQTEYWVEEYEAQEWRKQWVTEINPLSNNTK